MPEVNPYAAPVFADVVGPGDQFVDTAYTYVYNKTLTANQSLLGQVVSLDPDADFVLYAVQINSLTSVLGTLQLMDNQGMVFSNEPVNFGAFLIGGLPVPYAIEPGRIFAANGRILLNITDLSGAENTVQITFQGSKRYRLS